MSRTKLGWIGHLASHTGEYHLKRVPCDRQKGSHETLNTSKVIKKRKIKMFGNILNGYLCNLCNFVQILRTTLIKHCKEQHDIVRPELTKDYIQFKILDINVSENAEDFGDDAKVSTSNSSTKDPVGGECSEPNIVHLSSQLVPLVPEAEVPANVSNDIDMEQHDSIDGTFSIGVNIPSIKIEFETSSDETYETRSTTLTTELPQSTEPTEPPAENSQTNPVKPWTASSAMKNAKAVNFMLRDGCLFALFKCMSTNCIFSTNLAERMVQHLDISYLIDL